MLVTIATIILIMFAVFILAGMLFVFFFLARGLQKIDAGIHGSSIGFRIIIIPGCIVFWPVLLRKWFQVVREEKLNKVEAHT
jgi:hypothetical protein